MKHISYTMVKEEIPNEEGVKDVTVRWLVSKNDGAKHFAMRLFEVKPHGYTPLHQHDWEHEVFVVKGSGELRDKHKREPLLEGDVVFVPSMEWHQFVNIGDDILQFICVIPYK